MTHVDRGFGGGAVGNDWGGSLRRVREKGLSWSARDGESGKERDSGEDLVAAAAAAQGKERRRRGRGRKEVGFGEGKAEDAAMEARVDTR